MVWLKKLILRLSGAKPSEIKNNQMKSNTKTAFTQDNANEIITLSKQLERCLVDDFGATGRGLGEKAFNIDIPPHCLSRIRIIGEMRNKTVHQIGYKIDFDAYKKISREALSYLKHSAKVMESKEYHNRIRFEGYDKKWQIIEDLLRQKGTNVEYFYKGNTISGKSFPIYSESEIFSGDASDKK